MPTFTPDVEAILFYLLRKHTGGKRTPGVARWKLASSAHTTFTELFANNEILIEETDLTFFSC